MATSFESVNLHPILQDIILKTAPDNFMEPYDAQKVDMAHCINLKAYQTDIKNPLEVLTLIEEAIHDLGCDFSSESVYKYLLSIYKPTNNTKNFNEYNDLCQKLYLAKDSIADLIILVEEETNKEQELRKKELERARIERTKKEQEIKEDFILFLKGIGVLIIIFCITIGVYALIDYRRINKNHTQIIGETTSTRWLENKGASKYDYTVDVPCELADKYSSNSNKNYYSCSGFSLCIEILNDTNFSLASKVQEHKNYLINNGWTIEDQYSSDTLNVFTYDKYSLRSGREISTCVYIVKYVPFFPFPMSGINNNFLIRYNGYCATAETAIKIANSIKLRKFYYANQKNSTEYLTYQKQLITSQYRDIRKNDHPYDIEKSIKDFFAKEKGEKIPQNKDYTKIDPSLKYGKDSLKYDCTFDYPFAWLQIMCEDGNSIITSCDGNNWIYTTTHQMSSTEQLEDIRIVFPIDSISILSSENITVANFESRKEVIIGYHKGQEYHYVAYKVRIPTGFSTYHEPIYEYKKNIKEWKLIGYKNEIIRKKNDDIYFCILMGMTPQWHADNTETIEKIIKSIHISKN